MDIDCGDNSCRFATNRGGMRTNGGCRCFENAGFGPSAVGAALKMLPEITRLRAEVETLHEQLVSREQSAANLAAFAADPDNDDLYAARMSSPDWLTRDLLRTYWREHVKDQKALIYLARGDTEVPLDRRGEAVRAEIVALRRVRDAAQEVVGVLGEQYMAGAKLWFPALDDLRAALDAAKES